MRPDRLFAEIEHLHAGRPWGAVLDAGTGPHSLEWVAGLPTARWTAVTAGAERERSMRAAFQARMRAGDRLVLGSWTDESLLRGEVYDVVLADYLLGAVDGFTPYFQDLLFARLRRHVGGALYVVGLEPYPDAAPTPGGRLVIELARLRDACILLAGHRCYREYPMEWVVRHLERDGYRVTSARQVPIRYPRRFVDGQLDVCVEKVRGLADPDLRRSLLGHVEDLRRRAHALPELARGGIAFGSDYVVAARPE